MIFADIIADYLARLGLGTIPAPGVPGDIFTDFLPPAPDTCTAIFASGGLPPDSRLSYDEPTLQIRTRSASPAVAYTRCMEAYGALVGLRNIRLGGVYILHCTGLQSAPQTLGRDEAERSEYVINLQFHIHHPTRHRG